MRGERSCRRAFKRIREKIIKGLLQWIPENLDFRLLRNDGYSDGMVIQDGRHMRQV
jgi:hypothetical protein